MDVAIDLPKPLEMAIPAFIILMVIELALGRFRVAKANYELKDTAASLMMGVGNLLLRLPFAGLIAGVMAWAYQYRVFDIGYQWWAFLLIFFAEDFVYYWFHRLSHEHRFWWCAHINHHTSQHYNLSTALRQTWSGNLAGTFMLWVPLAWLGFPPALIAFQSAVSLVYQFWIHTETIGRLPAPIEWVFNTPSHHRVHHAINPRYLDRNYAGILIIWDRMFGSFEPENDDEPCRYGIVKQLSTFNPIRIAIHEWADMIRDAWNTPGIGPKLMMLFGPPGWSADGSRQTSRQMRQAWQATRPDKSV